MEAAKERPRRGVNTVRETPPPLPPRTYLADPRLAALLPDVPTDEPTVRAPSLEMEQAGTSTEDVPEERSSSPVPEELAVEETIPPPPVMDPVRPAPPIPFPRSSQERQESVVVERTPLISYPQVPVLSRALESLPSYEESTKQTYQTKDGMRQNGDMTKVALREETAPPLYPALSEREGLLDEYSLLSFYHNPVYEQLDDFINSFVQEEGNPHGPLFILLARYLSVCEEIAQNAVEESVTAEKLAQCFRDVWCMQERSYQHRAKCGEEKEGGGTVKYEVAVMSNEKLEEMRNLLNANRSITLHRRLSNDVEARALALQIQWLILNMNNMFMAEHGVSAPSPPRLLDVGGNEMSRVELRRALSDCFFHLRAPSVPKMFWKAVTGWITEMVCVLQKSLLVSDGIWILSHCLRLPSPSSTFSAPLIQTFVHSASGGKTKMDYCMAMLSLIMSPITGREQFLSKLSAHDAMNEGWTIVDEQGEREHNPVTISESDLSSLLDQLPITDFCSVAYVFFSSTSSSKENELFSLVAFHLLLMKILHEGIHTYASIGYSSLCKQIGMMLRKSIHELCSHWKLSRGMLSSMEENRLSREVDRVVVTLCHHVVSAQSLGLWQFLVDVPFDCVSEDCRLRLQYMLRVAECPSVRDIYAMSTEEMTESLNTCSLSEKMESVAPVDAVFLLNTLSAVVAESSADPIFFLKQIVQTCFVDTSTRDSFYKVGGEAIGIILKKKPSVLDSLITIIDRTIDQMEEHAMSIFTSSSLDGCRIGESVMGGILGKWLIGRSPERAGNRLARRILSSFHWGYDANGELWLPPPVHALCADVVVKAHYCHCTRSNGFIAKSVQKISKMASKIPDYEQQFNQFCWDILIKLKLKVEPLSSPPQADLAAFFVYTTQHGLTSPEIFADIGLKYVTELVNAGCSFAAVVLLVRAFQRFHAQFTRIEEAPSWKGVLESVIHADECSYAVQLLGYTSPSAVVRLITSAIVMHSHAMGSELDSYLRCWTTSLCIGRPTFNSDNATLRILGVIVRLAFERDPKTLLGIIDIVERAYQAQISAWKESSHGLLSFFVSNSTPPSLAIPSSLSVSPWSSYLFLLVEERHSFSVFYQFLYDALAKKDKCTLEDAIKKASGKSSMVVPLERIHVVQWANLLMVCEDATVFVLALQALACQMFAMRQSVGKQYQLCHKYYKSASTKDLWTNLLQLLTTRSAETRGLPRSVAAWIRAAPEIASPQFRDFAKFDLDYLLQLAISNDGNIWLDFIDLNALSAIDAEEVKMMRAACHDGGRTVSPPVPSSSLHSCQSRAVPFAVLPSHSSLPPPPRVDVSICVNPQSVTALVQPMLDHISKLAVKYLATSDGTEDKDRGYCELLKVLYVPATKNVNVVVQCGGRCTTPLTHTLQVTSSELSKVTDASISRNREDRAKGIAALQQDVVDQAATLTASLEYTATELCSLGVSHRHLWPSLRMSGRSFFYVVTGAVTSKDSPILFQAATSSLSHTLRTLGQTFIRGVAEEQLLVMQLVLDGFVLSDPIVGCFSPECLTGSVLVDVYRQLSDAVAQPELSLRALKLLSSLSVSSATSLPPGQFRPLMPLAFRNVTSSGVTDSPLAQLCLSHFLTFIFHKYPLNFAYGLELILSGCQSGSTPVVLLDAIVKKLDANNMIDPRGEFVVDGPTALNCIEIFVNGVSSTPSQLSSTFSRWQKYLDAIGALSQLFLFTAAVSEYSPESPHSIVQRELVESFRRITNVFSPFIAPNLPSMPPFSVSSEEAALAILGRFVALLNALPHNSVLPQGVQNVQSLVWQYYAERLSVLTHGTVHYYSVLERSLVCINWSLFWPSLRAMEGMDTVMCSRSHDCAPFVAQVVVRVPWSDVLKAHVPEDLLPSYLSLLFSVLMRLNAKQGNVAKVRASMAELLRMLGGRDDWSKIPVEKVESLGNSLSVVLPFDTSSNPSDSVYQLLSVWRSICVFRRGEYSSEVLLKQRVWVRSQLQLLLRGGIPSAATSYTNLLAEASNVASGHPNLRAFCVVLRELTGVWTEISDRKLGECLVTAWSAYLSDNPSSPLALSCTSTIISSLQTDQYTTALKVMDSTLRSYFKRPDSTWSEVCSWTTFPAGLRTNISNFLMCVPSSDNKAQPLLLVLYAFAIQDEKCVTGLADYLLNVKPKFVECEPSFALVLSLLLESSLNDSHRLRLIMDWLKKAAHDDRGGGILGAIGLAKQKSFSAKFRIVLSILELYITQQVISGERSPELRVRKTAQTPVINSRINAIKELAAQRANLPYSSTFSVANPFFTDPSSNHISHSSTLLLKISSTMFNMRFLYK